MKRRYKTELYRQRVSRIKEVMPHACIGVDVIVGFPGETDDHFKTTFDFIQELDVSYLHVFTYSERANTPAATMEGKVKMEVRRARNESLRRLSQKKKQHFYESHLGSIRPVLFEQSKKEGVMTGFTDNYIKVELPQNESMLNSISDVKLLHINPDGLAGALMA